MESNVYLALGSNIGDRIARMAEAEKLLSEHPEITIEQSSKLYETEPWPKHTPEDGRPVEGGEQNWHLNSVVRISTSLSPQNLLRAIQAVEQAMGKEKKPVWGSRIIDIDIVLYGTDIIDLPELAVPHLHMTDRQFVLVPLLEIAPDLKDPRTGRSYQSFLDEINDNHKVIPFQS